MKKKHVSWLLIAAAPLGLGIAMPSCPGQQEMKQQIETLQNSNLELTKKIQSLTTQVQTMNNDVSQIKTLLPQMTNVISGQKGAMDKIEADIRELQSRMSPAKGKKRK